ncbi:MAG: hypothetical protein DVS81_10420 [Candidatus Accumulibacter meliphilus]|jgi:hypothetical protein|uniref:Uncharacterized protein n=1 Tax=Candidatus Accumulibacter meliphilus TaxID=2211374 RepID=A0A369XT54_9PROT|nr:MAG: hypothetical protein DVS81_10420 [Candidatus Accumulibacter meliphilus]
MFFGISKQTVEDLFHRPAIGAATVLVMELAAQIEKESDAPGRCAQPRRDAGLTSSEKPFLLPLIS